MKGKFSTALISKSQSVIDYNEGSILTAKDQLSLLLTYGAKYLLQRRRKHNAARLCIQCQDLDILNNNPAIEKEVDFVLDCRKASLLDCPVCNLVKHRVPALRQCDQGASSLRLKLKFKGTKAYVWHENRVCGLIYPLAEWQDETHYPGVIVGTNVDYARISGWLTDCEDHHDEEKQIAAKPIDLLLIDVRRQCIVRKSSGERYFALSYVWGGTQMLQTTGSNLEELLEPGGLIAIDLPKTLKDAVALTDRLGGTYVWIDSLCIVQDSPDKHEYLARMDKVYSHAALTIVALDGPNADTPLPGVGPGSRLPVVRSELVKGIMFMSEPPHYLDTHLVGSHYESRGWTFQERVLSSRVLYISAQQILFQCPHTIKMESLPDKAAVEENELTVDEFGRITSERFAVQQTARASTIGTKGALLAGRQMSHLAKVADRGMQVAPRRAVVPRNHFFGVVNGDEIEVESTEDHVDSLHDGPEAERSRYNGTHDLQDLFRLFYPRRRSTPTSISHSEYEERERSGADAPLAFVATFRDLDQLVNPLWAANGWMNVKPRAVTWTDLLPLYEEMVENYTQRSLTHSTDILHAFAGLSSVFERIGQTSLMYGLPLKVLAAAILWIPRARMRRRLSKSGEPAGPTWSWASWEGMVRYSPSVRGKTGAYQDVLPLTIRLWTDPSKPDAQTPVLNFMANVHDCTISICKSVKPSEKKGAFHTFSLDGSMQSCGVIFGENVLGSNRHDSFTSQTPSGHQYTIVPLGFEGTVFELANLYGIGAVSHETRQRRQVHQTTRSFYSEVTVTFILLRRVGRFHERVTIGKMIKSALALRTPKRVMVKIK